MTFMLGKKPPERDPRTYRLSNVLAAQLPNIPSEQDWSQSVSYQMWGNDKFGCCGLASQAGLVATWTKNAQAEIILTTQQVLANYAEVSGFDLLTGAQDDGVILLQELKHWRKKGFDRPGQTRDYLTAYGYIGPKNVAGLKRSIAFLGGAIGGVQMPRGFLNLPPGAMWDLNAVTDHTPAGGHAIALTGYNENGVFFASWGARSFMPWTTWVHIADECYGLLSRQNWLGIHGRSPQYEAFETLLKQAKAVEVAPG